VARLAKRLAKSVGQAGKRLAKKWPSWLAKDWLKEKAKLAKSGQSKMAKPTNDGNSAAAADPAILPVFTSFQNPCKPLNPSPPSNLPKNK
jgi:hypothetical protein